MFKTIDLLNLTDCYLCVSLILAQCGVGSNSNFTVTSSQSGITKLPVLTHVQCTCQQKMFICFINLTICFVFYLGHRYNTCIHLLLDCFAFACRLEDQPRILYHPVLVSTLTFLEPSMPIVVDDSDNEEDDYQENNLVLSTYFDDCFGVF